MARKNFVPMPSPLFLGIDVGADGSTGPEVWVGVFGAGASKTPHPGHIRRISPSR